MRSIPPRTACGARRSISSDSSRYSMRSHLSAKQSRARPAQSKSPYKTRITPPSPPLRMGVQEIHEVVPEITQNNGCIVVRIVIPQTEYCKDLKIKGDIAIDRNGEKHYVTLKEK